MERNNLGLQTGLKPIVRTEFETLLNNRSLPTAELVAQLFAAVDDFAMGQTQSDDITCLAVRRCVTAR